MSNATAGAEKIGVGVGPDGNKVEFWEADRPGTIGAHGSTGFIVLVVDPKTGEKITHSDTLVGLKSAGYVVDSEDAVQPNDEPVALEAPKKRGRPKKSDIA